ncbi:3-phosphoshikimate 1-carboxyvinyltransferase [Candidatus Epulonipiscium fishelsonii]|uniref:3-phosphoshikimate 1-carboxyvinyltransferase n=1 Tax=Candidatus Epulonipiscium fishelsonii TaxID=77094 RepID=A0ACC8XB17_9FIRM|nr:3-phosphoshikimate 1-carboxyvinyltransferase [Epulopiscium sp. SCG-B05WGA-EpuloA1]ONI39472.1 3-phosphoshikimate 1-carboxyvinyltransferase [Epulopiscium sp. SCG-B11WGA-EpuloA1]
MKKIKIIPSKLSGEITIPPSKSMAHRAIICASLSAEDSTISNIDFSEDIIATIDGMRALGASIKIEENTLYISGKNLLDNSEQNKDMTNIGCNESGSTLRFLVPISLINENRVRFTGKGNLGKRPLTPFYNIFDKQGIKYIYSDGVMDLMVEGKIRSGEFELEGNISSQFISGLLFMLPLLKGNSKITITSPLESKGYIDLTLQMINLFGVSITNNNYQSFEIVGGQSYRGCNYVVEGDFSQAAFFLVAGAIGNDIVCKGLNIDSLQRDKMALEFLQRMGAKVNINGSDIVVTKNKLEAIVMDGSECPDIVPIMAVASALCEGTTMIINAGRLRIKECDRLMAITKELGTLGANITELSDGLKIIGVDSFVGNTTVYSHKDHRIAMSIAIAATICDNPIILEEPDCVSKSYPSFWEDYKALGGIIEVIDFE